MQKNGMVDYYQLDDMLTAAQRRIRDRVREFVDRDCLPIVAGHFDKGTFPMELIPRMAEMGLFGVHVEGYGCRQTDETAYGLVCQELGRCDSGLRALFSVQNSLAMFPIYQFGSEQQKKKWLPEMARGEAIGCFGLSEPGFGSNPGGMQTRAEKKGDRYVLNGTKMWITNGTIAKVAVVWAKFEEKVRGFLVETRLKGFEATPIGRKFSYRTSPTARISLRNCEIDADCILPGTTGLRSVFSCLNFARYGVACGAVGSAVACFQAARRFAVEREVFGKPIASYQLVQKQLAEMLTEITKAQLLTSRLGRLMDEGRARPQQISMAKLNNVEAAMKVARAARDILGGRGILADQHVIRHLCDLEAVSALEGTANMHTLVLGQDITGISAFG